MSYYKYKHPFSYESLEKLEKKVFEILTCKVIEHTREKKKLLSVREASKLMGISITKIYKQISKFNLCEGVFRIRRDFRLDKQEIENKLSGEK
jgi:hypothetical protein